MLRREVLKTALVTLSALGIGTPGSATAVSASGSLLLVSGLPGKLAAALRLTGNEGCIAAAARLEATTIHVDVRLHLRGVGLTASDAERIAGALSSLTLEEAPSLTSLTLSYNEAIGDAGAVSLADALPRSLRELGLVGCQIGDTGGAALLEWTRRATRLRMLCIEGNRFSEEIRTRFGDLQQTNSRLSVYV